jgi:hypothetical protein
MKNLFLIACLFFNIGAWGQVPKSDVVSASLPKGAISLRKEQVSKIVHDNFKRSSIPLDVENYYQLDGIVMSFWDDEVNPEFKRSLEDIQLGMLGIFKRNNDVVNFSKIISVNNIRFLVYEYQIDDEVNLCFQSDFNKHNKHIGGIVQFKKPDEDKGQKVLQGLLQSMHFKD